MKNNNASPDNQPNQTPDHSARQAKRSGAAPAERTADAGYQKLPLQYRPKVSRDQRDPIDYDSHLYPSMKSFAEFLTLRFDAPRTRHSYYRQIGLVEKFSQCDPASVTEERLRDYILHVKTRKLWKPKTIRQSANPPACFSSRCSAMRSEKYFPKSPPKTTRLCPPCSPAMR